MNTTNIFRIVFPLMLFVSMTNYAQETKYNYYDHYPLVNQPPKLPMNSDPCYNMGFEEEGDFTNWVRTKCNSYDNDINNCLDTVFAGATHTSSGGRHYIIDSSANLKDMCAGIPMVAPGSRYSMRLGNMSTGAQSEQLLRTFIVTPDNNSFTYKYAVVFQDPAHPFEDQPFFHIDMLNQFGDTIPCSPYHVTAGDGIEGFQDATLCGKKDVYYKDWTVVNMNLTPYMGEQLTIRFHTSDCMQGAHFGYAYIDLECKPFRIEQTNEICTGDTAYLSAPAGAGSYTWRGPNGFTATDSVIAVTEPGEYKVEMYSVQGCYSELFHILSDKDIISDFSTNDICVGDSAFFQVYNDTSGATPTDWEWNFGDGGGSHEEDAFHIYNSPGNYTVSLQVNSNGGCKDSISKNITVHPPPDPDFQHTTVCVGQATDFTDASPANMIAWEWDFGDSSALSQTQNTTHTYAQAGSYSVTLSVTDDKGCSNDIMQTIEVLPGPTPTMQATEVCLGESTSFQGNSNETVISWAWDFGDGNSSNTQNTNHTYAQAGSYDVTLTINTNGNCPGIKTIPVMVNELPTADFTSDDVCLSKASAFTNTSTGNVITSWDWDFGDGNNSSEEHPSHTYQKDSTYQVTLKVITDKGCEHTFSKNVTVYPAVIPDFIGDSVCLNEITSFQDFSNAFNQTIDNWSWNFGDGDVSRDQHPQHTYNTSGTYKVNLTVSSNGCTDSTTKTIEVYPLPTADFSLTPQQVTILDPQVTITDLSLGGSIGNWNLGDGNNQDYTAGESIVHLYPNDNTQSIITYEVTLDIINEYGCPDIISKPLTVEPIVSFYIPDAFTPNKDDKNETFFGKGFGIKEYQMWIFDRWGNQIFHCDIDDVPQNPLCHWNGIVEGGTSGEVAQQDVYVWKVVLKDVFDEQHHYIGHVSLIK